MFLDLEASTLAGWLLWPRRARGAEADAERNEDRRWDGGWGREKENTQMVGMRVVKAVLLPAKAGNGSVLRWRKLKLEEKLQEGELGKEVAKWEGEKIRQGTLLQGKVEVVEQSA